MADFRVGEKRVVAATDMAAGARYLWSELAPGSVIWLSGELGTGKTTFVQQLAIVAQAEAARSPTFSLVHEYVCGDGLLIHADCYRLRSPDEALDLDFPDLTRRARLLVIEWPERAGSLAPVPDAHLAFSHCDDPDHRVMERIA